MYTMTLVVTELTANGICMAADSTITRVRNGRVVQVDEKSWSKLLEVRKIRAAISYWGLVGAYEDVQAKQHALMSTWLA